MTLLTQAFEQLLTMALTAAPVMAVVLAARLALRKAPKKYSYWLWAVVAFRLVCPVAPESPVGLVPVEETAQQITAAAEAYLEPTLTYRDNGGFTPDYDVLLDRGYTPNAYGEIVTNEAGTREALQAGDLLSVAAALWLAGMAAIAAYLIYSTLRLKKQVACAVRWEDNVWECGGIPTPFVLGLLRPRIYVPFRLSPQERDYILAHERYHIRHGDPWAKTLALLLLAVYWWDPLVWLCWGPFCRDLEMRCDEAVLAELGGGVKQDYSLSLLSFALDRRAPMALAFGEHEAAKRVKNVLRWRQAGPAVMFLAVSAVLLVALVCGTNARTGSWVRLDSQSGHGISFTVQAKDPILSWGIYEDVYKDGELVSSAPQFLLSYPRPADAVKEHFPSRSFTATLLANPERRTEGGFAGALDCSLTLSREPFSARWTTDLPGGRYTGVGSVPMDGYRVPASTLSRKQKLADTDSAVLLTVFLSTEPNGALVGYHAGEGGVFAANDTVVQYRLVVSTENPDALRIEQLDPQLLSLARTLHGLRAEKSKDLSAVEPLLEAIGVPALGEYTLERRKGTGRENALLISFSGQPEDKEAFESRMWMVCSLLTALVEDADGVHFSYPDTVDGQQVLRTVYADEELDRYARALRCETFKDLGQTPESLCALMAYLGWNGGASPGAVLLYQAQTMNPMELTRALLVTELWGGTVDGGTVGWPGNFGPSVTFEEAPADPDALDAAMARRAVLLMQLRPEEVGYVMWSYPDASGETQHRNFHREEAGMILALSSAYDLSGNIDALISFLNIGADLFVHYAREDLLPSQQAAEQSAVWFAPGDVHNIESLALALPDGSRASPLTGGDYDLLLPLLAGAGETGETNCAFSGLLYLRRADGVTGKMQVAADGCGVFRSDGRYYRFDADSGPFYAAFGLTPEDMLSGTETAPEAPEVFANVFLQKEDAGDLLDGYLPQDIYYDLDTYEYETTEPLQCYLYYYDLSRAQFRRFTEGLEVIPDEWKDIELEGNEADTANITVCDYLSRAELEQVIEAISARDAAEDAGLPDAAPPDAILPDEGFADILGFAGYIVTEPGVGGWSRRVYYTVRGGGPMAIAESFGYGAPQDYVVDLDGDGVTELIANVQYGGDGAQRAYVYQRRGSDIYRGELLPEGLPNFDDRGAGAYLSEYDPEEGLFRLRYAQKNSREYGLLETRDLSRLSFVSYAP